MADIRLNPDQSSYHRHFGFAPGADEAQMVLVHFALRVFAPCKLGRPPEERWIIPKGWPIKGLKPAKSAAREASNGLP
jgi:hypothetical protein